MAALSTLLRMLRELGAAMVAHARPTTAVPLHVAAAGAAHVAGPAPVASHAGAGQSSSYAATRSDAFPGLLHRGSGQSGTVGWGPIVGAPADMARGAVAAATSAAGGQQAFAAAGAFSSPATTARMAAPPVVPLSPQAAEMVVLLDRGKAMLLRGAFIGREEELEGLLCTLRLIEGLEGGRQGQQASDSGACSAQEDGA